MSNNHFLNYNNIIYFSIYYHKIYQSGTNITKMSIEKYKSVSKTVKTLTLHRARCQPANKLFVGKKVHNKDGDYGYTGTGQHENNF